MERERKFRGISGRQARKRERIRFRAAARRIAQAYGEATGSTGASSSTIGTRRVRRQAVAPRFRPESVLKRQIYELACTIADKGSLQVLQEAVIKRDAAWDLSHRPRQHTPIDWTIRLVRGALLGKPPATGVKRPKLLFDGTTQSRFSIELNFAFRQNLKPELVTMFIDEMGGHEIISAQLAVGGYDLTNATWMAGLQRRQDSWFDRQIQAAHDDDEGEHLSRYPVHSGIQTAPHLNN